MFAKHEFGLIYPHVFRAHDLIRRLMLEHAILMNAGFVCKRIRAYDRFVGLHNHARVITDKSTDTRDLPGFNSCLKAKDWMPGFEGHNNFFKRCIAGALTYSIDGHFCLSRTRSDSSQRVRCRKPKVIMAM